MAIILKNATFIHWETLKFSQTNILVEEGEDRPLQFYEHPDEIPAGDDRKVIDCQGMLVTKSFAVAHHHVYSALARGMPPSPKAPGNFLEILQSIWWRLDKALDKETIEASALVTAMACAKAGSTFVIDHHASPNYIKGSLEIIAKAFDQVGVSHLLCYEVTDRDGPEKANQGLEENERHLQQHQGLIGLHASFTLGDDTMKKAAALMDSTGAGVHIHLSEDLHDLEDCVQKYGTWVTDRLQEFGFLDNPASIMVHGLHLDEYERRFLLESKAWLVENMESNLNNKVGIFNSKGLDSSRIMLGTDGMHSDILQSARAAYFAGQQAEATTPMGMYRRLHNVHRYLQLNHFKGDGDNNLVVLDYDSPTPVNQENLSGHLFYGLNSRHVRHVISNGRLLVSNNIIQTVDESAILQYARQQAVRLWDRMQSSSLV